MDKTQLCFPNYDIDNKYLRLRNCLLKAKKRPVILFLHLIFLFSLFILLSTYRPTLWLCVFLFGEG